MPEPKLMIEVLKAVSDCSGVSVELLRGPRRSRGIARPRQVAMYVMSERCPFTSFPQIGDMLGFRDHKTIMHGCGVIKRLLNEDQNVANLYRAVTRALDDDVAEAAE